MSDPGDGPDPRPDRRPDQPPDPRPGQVRPLRPGPPVVLGLLALVAAWSVRPLGDRLGFTQPLPSIWGLVVVWAFAVGVAVQARATTRRLRRTGGPTVAGPSREGLTPSQAVNRLVLAQAVALSGAIVLGAYAGLAIGQLGVPASELLDDRLWRSAIGALGGAAMIAAGLWLEHACRIRGGDDDSLP